MEIVQNMLLRINNIEDSEAFYEFMEEEGGIFFEEMDDNIDDSLEFEIMDAYEEFNDMIKTLKAIVTDSPKLN